MYETFDSPNNNLDFYYSPENNIDMEDFKTQEEKIRAQYVDLIDLGINLLEDIDEEYQLKIIENLVDYVDTHYFYIPEKDALDLNLDKRFEIGKVIYKFICIDLLNTIIPNVFSENKIGSAQQYELIITRKYNFDFNKLRKTFLRVIDKTIGELINLKKLDNSISKDKNYVELVKRYTYYLQMLEGVDFEKLNNNLLQRLINKYETQIIWRSF